MGRKLRHRHDRYELSNALTSTSVLPLPPFRLRGKTHQSLRDLSTQPEADGVERETAKAANAKPLKLQGNTRANPCGILANCAGKHEASGVGCGRVQATSQGDHWANTQVPAVLPTRTDQSPKPAQTCCHNYRFVCLEGIVRGTGTPTSRHPVPDGRSLHDGGVRPRHGHLR